MVVSRYRDLIKYRFYIFGNTVSWVVVCTFIGRSIILVVSFSFFDDHCLDRSSSSSKICHQVAAQLPLWPGSLTDSESAGPLRSASRPRLLVPLPVSAVLFILGAPALIRKPLQLDKILQLRHRESPVPPESLCFQRNCSVPPPWRQKAGQPGSPGKPRR